jgi:AraC-like DNA-binding protein
MYFYQEFDVCANLQPWVECIWVLHDKSGRFKNWSRLLPDNTLEVVLTQNNIRRRHNYSKQNFYSGSSHVACLKTNLQFVSISNDVNLIGARIKPFAWRVFSDKNPVQYVNSIISIEDYFRNSNQSFLGELHLESDLMIRHKLLEFFLLSNLNEKIISGISTIQCATERILSSHGNIKISQLAQECNCSEKTLERYFYYYIGVSPKQYAKLIRIRSLLNYKLNTNDCNASKCAETLGFYDATHFFKELKNIAHAKPSEILSSQSSDENNIQLYMLERSKGLSQLSSGTDNSHL